MAGSVVTACARGPCVTSLGNSLNLNLTGFGGLSLSDNSFSNSCFLRVAYFKGGSKYGSNLFSYIPFI